MLLLLMAAPTSLPASSGMSRNKKSDPAIWTKDKAGVRAILRGRHESARPPAAAAHPDRPFGLPARLPLDLRARGRGARRPHASAGCAARQDNAYTAGVICAKVARYAERIHHPDRLTASAAAHRAEGLGPVRARSRGTRRSTSSPRNSSTAEARYGARGGLALLLRRHHGPRDARRHQPPAPRQEILRLSFHHLRQRRPGPASSPAPASSPVPIRARWRSPICVVIWGTNPVNTQVNVMTHATRARKERGAKIVAIDIYMNGTMKQADLAVLVRPGTDGALACAVMHVPVPRRLRRLGLSATTTPTAPRELEAHLRDARRREWAAAITGCPVATIEAFARLVGATKRTYLPPRLRLRALAQRRRSTCMRRAASRRSPAPGSTRAAARSTTTAPSITGTSR